MTKVKRNPDVDFCKEIENKLKENNGFCPCRLQKTNDTKCICKEFKEMIKNQIPGMCHCGLYIIEEVNENE